MLGDILCHGNYKIQVGFYTLLQGHGSRKFCERFPGGYTDCVSEFRDHGGGDRESNKSAYYLHDIQIQWNLSPL